MRAAHTPSRHELADGADQGSHVPNVDARVETDDHVSDCDLDDATGCPERRARNGPLDRVNRWCAAAC
jgi:hypothetical protein